MIKFVSFECSIIKQNKTDIETCSGTITILKDYSHHYDLMIKTISCIRLIYGETSSGFFVCFPDFELGCTMVNVYDRFSNKKRLVRILGETDATIVEAALKCYSLSRPFFCLV